MSAETWREAQRLKTTVNAKHLRTKSGASSGTYLLTGILRCGACGSPMRGKSSGTKLPAYYICSRRAYYGKTDGCAGPSIHRAWAEKTVFEYLDRLFHTPDVVAAIFEKAARRVKRELPEARSRLDEVRSEIAKLEAKQRKWMDRYEETDDGASAELLWTRIRELKAAQLALRAEAEALESKLASSGKRRLAPEDVAKALTKLPRLADAPAEKQRVLLDRLVHRHDLRIRLVDERRLALALRLDAVDDDAEHLGKRLFLVTPSSSGKGGGKPPGLPRPMSPDSPMPGGPTRSRAWLPATATSNAARAPSWPRTSDRSRGATDGGRHREARASGSGGPPSADAMTSCRWPAV